jgi:hypothetical protein
MRARLLPPPSNWHNRWFGHRASLWMLVLVLVAVILAVPLGVQAARTESTRPSQGTLNIAKGYYGHSMGSSWRDDRYPYRFPSDPNDIYAYINQKCGYTFRHSQEVVVRELGQRSGLQAAEWQALALRLGSLRAALVCHDIADGQDFDSYVQTTMVGRAVQSQQDVQVGDQSLAQLDFIDSAPDDTDALVIRRVLFMMGDGKVLEVWLDSVQTDGTVSHIDAKSAAHRGFTDVFARLAGSEPGLPHS